MEKIVEMLMTWQFGLICLVTSGLIGAVAQIGSKKGEDGKRTGGLKGNVWFQRLNPLLPYFVAPGLLCIPGVPLPAEMPATWGAKIMFGLAAAVLSDVVYTKVKKLIGKNGGS